MDVDYSPTGREFVAGGYDRSVRIFNFNAGHSREVRALAPGLALVLVTRQKA
jgi:WD40 repeat protein